MAVAGTGDVSDQEPAPTGPRASDVRELEPGHYLGKLEPATKQAPARRRLGVTAVPSQIEDLEDGNVDTSMFRPNFPSKKVQNAKTALESYFKGKAEFPYQVVSDSWEHIEKWFYGLAKMDFPIGEFATGHYRIEKFIQTLTPDQRMQFQKAVKSHLHSSTPGTPRGELGKNWEAIPDKERRDAELEVLKSWVGDRYIPMIEYRQHGSVSDGTFALSWIEEKRAWVYQTSVGEEMRKNYPTGFYLTLRHELEHGLEAGYITGPAVSMLAGEFGPSLGDIAFIHDAQVIAFKKARKTDPPEISWRSPANEEWTGSEFSKRLPSEIKKGKMTVSQWVADTKEGKRLLIEYVFGRESDLLQSIE